MTGAITIQLKKISQSPLFKNGVTFLVLLSGLIVGLQTYPEIHDPHYDLLHSIDRVIVALFLVELAIRIGSYGKRPFHFFKEGWNVFDFVIVAVCALPLGGDFLAVLRLARVLRVLRLVSAFPKLQLLVGALLKSIPSIGYITALLMLEFYVYACIGSFLFGRNDPLHFGNLHRSMITLFQVVTLEEWPEIMKAQLYGTHVHAVDLKGLVAPEPAASPVAAVLFFISFILTGTMIVLNLFIGVIINGMAEMHVEVTARKNSDDADEIDQVVRDLDTIKKRVLTLRRRLENPKSLS